MSNMVAVMTTQPMDVIKTKLSTQNWINSKFCCKKIDNCNSNKLINDFNSNLNIINKNKICIDDKRNISNNLEVNLNLNNNIKKNYSS